MATTETILEATIKAGVEHFGGFPPGSMIAFAGKAIPEGWLLCNGALVSRTTYARLFAAIGTAWGAGDGRTTFKLPDANGRVMQGVTDASKVGQYLKAGLPDISGSFSVYTGCDMNPNNDFYPTASGAFSVREISRSGESYQLSRSRPEYTFSASNSNQMYSGNTVQPNAFQTLIIIKA